MGGFIFGYDTGQISGFLGMAEFQQRFGQKNGNGDGGYHFSNVRSGLIVALLSVGTLMGALIGGPVADRIGRKWSISAWCLSKYFLSNLLPVLNGLTRQLANSTQR
jgi:SP family sugar:H+ symporter-like MFS transporter